MSEVGTISTKPAPNPEWEAKAKAFRDDLLAESGPPNPFDTLTMLERWTADAEPANEHGQVSFSRAMLESAESALREALNIARNEHLRAERAETALRPFASFGEYVGGLRVTVAGASIKEDEVLPDDEIATIGNTSGFATIRGKHFAEARKLLQKPEQQGVKS